MRLLLVVKLRWRTKGENVIDFNAICLYIGEKFQYAISIKILWLQNMLICKSLKENGDRENLSSIFYTRNTGQEITIFLQLMYGMFHPKVSLPA